MQPPCQGPLGSFLTGFAIIWRLEQSPGVLGNRFCQHRVSGGISNGANGPSLVEINVEAVQCFVKQLTDSLASEVHFLSDLL